MSGQEAGVIRVVITRHFLKYSCVCLGINLMFQLQTINKIMFEVHISLCHLR